MSVTFYSRGDGSWTVLGYDDIETWLEDQGQAAVEYVHADDFAGAVRALEEIRDADPVNMALDPGWPARIAGAALA